MGPSITAPAGKGAVKDVREKEPSPRVCDGLINLHVV